LTTEKHLVRLFILKVSRVICIKV